MSTIYIKNLGPIKEGTIELKNKLLMLCGPNNSGKTYLSTLLYAINRMSIDTNVNLGLFKISKDDIRFNIHSTGKKEAVFEIDLVDIYTKNKELILSSISIYLLSMLHRAFGATKDIFNNSELKLIVKDDSEFKNILINTRYSILSNSIYYQSTGIQLYKEDGNGKALVSLIDYENDFENKEILDQHLIPVQDIILQIVKLIFVSGKRTEGYYFPTERMSIDLFLFDIFSKRDYPSIDERRDRQNYLPVSVTDLIELYSRISFQSIQPGPFYEFGLKIEKTLFQGQLSLSSNRSIVFESKESGALSMNLVSTSIRSLAIIIIYFKFIARNNHMVFIDEPELGLHPELQRKVAIIIAEAIKLGFNLVISTHSEFFVKELNNLIILNRDSQEAKELREKYAIRGYDNTINFKDVSINVLENGKCIPISVSADGFEVSTIDQTIIDQNSIIEEIYNDLF